MFSETVGVEAELKKQVVADWLPPVFLVYIRNNNIQRSYFATGRPSLFQFAKII
jgi:hypothetical protein